MDSQADLNNSRQRGTKSQQYCDEAKRLLGLFGEAVQDVLILHEQQFHAVVEGDITANRFDLLIHEANRHKQNAKYKYMMHLQEHACSSLHDEIDDD